MVLEYRKLAYYGAMHHSYMYICVLVCYLQLSHLSRHRILELWPKIISDMD